ncbi:hypothetical protein F4810DRAFT_652294 [Camillea tinctor]|nr:hypothetical protein F4810DRAFT_652294 [Camillea tinctor]
MHLHSPGLPFFLILISKMALSLGAVQVAVVSFISITLAFISFGLRMWSRRIQRIPLRFSDYMIIIAIVITSGAVASFLAAAFAAGLGVHLQEILATDPAIFALHVKLFVPCQVLWAAANSCVKLSILSLYITLFPNKRFARICYGTMVVTVAYFLSVFLETFLLCRPVQYSWDKSIPGGTCYNQNLAYLIAGITNLVIDAFVVALPMPMLFRLQMDLSKKISIIAMFSLGALICVVSFLRVLWAYTWDLNDFTYTVTPGAIYSVIEPTLGVVNACLPTIKPAIKKVFGPGALAWGSKDRSRKGYVYSGRRQDPEARPASSSLHHTFAGFDDSIPLTNVQAESTPSPDCISGGKVTVTRGWGVTEGS